MLVVVLILKSYTTHLLNIQDLYVQDRLVRHGTLDQSKIYLKNYSQDANLSVKELKDAIKNNNGKSFISKNTIYKFKTYIYHLKFA